MLAIWFILCAVALGALLYAEATQNARLKYAAKPVASTAFVAVGITHLVSDPSPFAISVVVGLVFGALGDVCLMLPSKKWFLAGMAVFAIGHGAYVVAFDQLLAWPLWWSLASLIPIGSGIAAYVWLHPHLGSMRWPVTGYVIIIVLMTVGAVAAAAHSITGLIAGIGAGAFFISDLAVARNRFIEKSFTNRAWGLPLYYGGQLLIAASLAVG